MKSPSRPTLLVPVAGGSRGLRWSGGHQPDNPQAQGAVGEDLPGMEGPGGLEEKRNRVEGEVWETWKGSVRGALTPEGWSFLSHYTCESESAFSSVCMFKA